MELEDSSNPFSNPNDDGDNEELETVELEDSSNPFSNPNDDSGNEELETWSWRTLATISLT